MISKTQIIERLNKMPLEMRNRVFSEDTDSMLSNIASENHLADQKSTGFIRFVGFALLGFMDLNTLKKNLQEDLHIPAKSAEHITDEVKEKIFIPLSDDLRAFYDVLRSPEPTAEGPQPPSQPAPQPTPQSEPIKPTLEKPVVSAQESAPVEPRESAPQDQVSPYVIHTDEGGIKQVTRTGGGADLVRPYFYDPAQSSLPKEEKPVAARLEIGGEGGMKKKKPKKAGEANIRVVHYSGPQTPVDPFQGQPEKDAVQPEAKPSDPSVHPDNIVNLKDIPK